MSQSVDVSLSADEALVLFELLSRWSEDEGAIKPGPDCFQSPAEVGALLSVLAGLQTQLVEPFQSDYRDLLCGARQRVSLQVGEDLEL